ncbi:HNH endonuclease [Prescottella equi]|uniref:HNH endonuclease n=1 Tax=Rhodococcus hoagii TaxID=43767 RepID=UPI0033071353
MPWARGQSRTSTAHWRRLKRSVTLRDGNRCAGCGIDGRHVALQLAHIVGDAEGGAATADNVRLLCGPCHAPETKAEADRGKARKAARRRLPPTPHPGLR